MARTFLQPLPELPGAPQRCAREAAGLCPEPQPQAPRRGRSRQRAARPPAARNQPSFEGVGAPAKRLTHVMGPLTRHGTPRGLTTPRTGPPCCLAHSMMDGPAARATACRRRPGPCAAAATMPVGRGAGHTVQQQKIVTRRNDGGHHHGLHVSCGWGSSLKSSNSRRFRACCSSCRCLALPSEAEMVSLSIVMEGHSLLLVEGCELSTRMWWHTERNQDTAGLACADLPPRHQIDTKRTVTAQPSGLPCRCRLRLNFACVADC